MQLICFVIVRKNTLLRWALVCLIQQLTVSQLIVGFKNIFNMCIGIGESGSEFWRAP